MEQFKSLARESWQLGELMQKLVPVMHVYLVRLPGDNRLLPRAQVKLSLSGHIRSAHLSPELTRLTESTITIDLFERPVHERIRKDCVRLAAEHASLIAIAAQLEGASERVVKRALDLHQRMVDLGLDDPYVQAFQVPEAPEGLVGQQGAMGYDFRSKGSLVASAKAVPPRSATNRASCG